MDSNKSLTYLNSIQKRYDTVHVIWLDEANDSHMEAKQNLNNIVQHISIFTNADECIAHILSLNEIAKVFLILSKYYAQTIISFVCQLSQVSFTYVMCVSALERGGLSTFLSDDKIGGIFHDENSLFLKLTHDVVRSSGNHPSSIPMIVMNSQEESRQNYLTMLELEQSRLSVLSTIIRHSIKEMSKQCGTYTWHQLLIAVLLRMKNSNDAKMDMLNECRLCYKDDISEQRKIDDFDENYGSDKNSDLTKAIWWYTRDSFLYRELNKALRTEKIEQLFMFRYFISDLHTQLVQLHSDYVALLEECDLNVIMAYRGQTITSDEFEKLEQNIGRFISMNTFISTTTNRDVAIIYAGDGSQSPELESVPLEITVDIHIRTKPFANITEYSYFHDEDEILFSIGTLFQIESIKKLEDQNVWSVKLRFCEDDNVLMEQFITSCEKDMDETTTVNTFADFLAAMGEDIKAEEYYKKMLSTSNENTNSDQTVKAYKGLGHIAFNNGDYQKSIEIFQKVLVLSDQSMAILSDANFCIGQSYKSLEDYDQCLTYYTKALADRTNPLLPTRYIEIALI